MPTSSRLNAVACALLALLPFACGRSPAVGADPDDPGDASGLAALGPDATSSLADDTGLSGAEPEPLPPDGPRPVEIPPADAALTSPADAALPAPPDASAVPPVPPPADCRVYLGHGGEPCDEATFPACSLPFGAGCCTRDLMCGSGRIIDMETCDDICAQDCGQNHAPDTCELQLGCSWFVGGCGPGPEGTVSGPACVPTPGGLCATDADCPAGQRCMTYWIDPCGDEPCDACGAEAHQCAFDGPVVPGPCDPDCFPEGVLSDVPCGENEEGCTPACLAFCRRSVCVDALRHVQNCFADASLPAGLGWPLCSPADACAAQCALGLECGALMCSFRGDVDCDGASKAWEDCVEASCGPAACPDDCGMRSPDWDCCGGGWTCGTTCDQDCVVPAPEENMVCRCAGGACLAVANPL